MKASEDFLNNLNDTELAIFIVYRYTECLESAKELIKKQISIRRLSQDKLNKLFEIGLSEDNNLINACPRCNSNRFHLETDYALKQKSYGSYEIAIDSKRCMLCGFNAAKDKPTGFINKIKSLLGSYKVKRLKRPEIDGQLFIR